MREQYALEKFDPKDGFEFNGNFDNMPEWADKGWAAYDKGPALAVPKGDPHAAPYVTVVARRGDMVFINKAGDRYFVVNNSAKEAGDVHHEQEPASLEKSADKPDGGAENQKAGTDGDSLKEPAKAPKKAAASRRKA